MAIDNRHKSSKNKEMPRKIHNKRYMGTENWNKKRFYKRRNRENTKQKI